MYVLSVLRLGRLHQPLGRVYQAPLTRNGITVVTPAFIRAAHSVGQEVYVWTINDPAQMRRLLEMGVDGIITNRPDLLKEILNDFKRSP